MSSYIDYTGKPASFIAVSHLGLVLDLECLSEYENAPSGATWDSEEGLVSLTGIYPPGSIYGELNFQSNPLPTEPGAAVTLSGLQALDATGETTSEGECSLNFITHFVANSSSDLEGILIPSDLSATGSTAPVLYSCVIDNSTVLCTATGISLYNHKREKSILNISFSLNAACRIEDTIYLGTDLGLYKITLSDLFTGVAPQLELDTSTTPALASNVIMSISVDNAYALISYAGSSDLFPSTFDAVPVNLTNVQGVSHIYENRVYTIVSGTAKVGFLPQSSGSVTLVDVLTTEFTRTNLGSGRIDVGDGFYLIGSLLYNSSGVSLGNIQTLSNVTIYTIKNAALVNGKLWLMAWHWEADGFSYVRFPYTTYGRDYYVFCLLTFTVTEDTLTFIDVAGIDSYNNTSSEAPSGAEDIFDYLVEPVTGPVSKVGDILTFYATVRDSVERIYYSPTGYRSTSQPESWISKFELNTATGAVAKVYTKILNHVHSAWPVTEWQYYHYLNFSPFVDPGPGLTGVLYASKSQDVYSNGGYYQHEFAKAFRSIMLWDVDSYDEATSTYTQPVACDHDFSDFLEVDFLVRVDADRIFALCKNKSTDNDFAVLFGNNNALLGETPYFPAIGEPLPIDRMEEKRVTAVKYIGPHMCHYIADLQYVTFTGSDQCYTIKITPTGLTLGFTSPYATQVTRSGEILTSLYEYAPVFNAMSNITSLLKGQGVFIVDSGNLWAIPSGGGHAIIVARNVVAAAVSEDATAHVGYVTFADTNKKVLTKPVSLETGDWYSSYVDS